MRPADFPKLVAALLAGAIALEATLLAGVFRLGDGVYHGLHLAQMATLVVAQLALWRGLRRTGADGAPVALAWAIGAASTAVGDYVNGAVSGVEPVSLKLTWALLLFGIGYTCYTVVLGRHAAFLLRHSGSGLWSWRYRILLLILAFNVFAWFQHVEANAAGRGLLYYGSFVFNATLYVLLPSFAIWYFVATRYATGALLVLIGAVLIPYSDLVLFDSWLRGDPAVPEFDLYAANWIVYFGGQALFSLFPALFAGADSRPIGGLSR